MPVIGATQLEPVNILGSYVQGMELGRANRLARQQEAAAVAQAQREAEMRNYLATADLSTPEAQNQLLRFGEPGAKMAQSLATIGRERTQQENTQLEIAGRKIKRQRDLLAPVGDQAGWTAWRNSTLQAYGDVPEMAQVIPEQYSPAAKQQLLLSADDIVARLPMSQERFEQEQKLRRSSAPQTTITMAAAKEFAGALGKQAAARLDDFRSKAESARSTLQTSQQLLPLLDDPNFISGTLANARLAVAKAVGIDVSATESYFAGVGQQVAERITAFGAGTGLSDADREFAKKIAAGEETLSVKSIRRIIDINNRSAQNVIDTYNKERTRLGKKEPEVLDYYPELDTPQVGPPLSQQDQQALTWANSNPNDPRAAQIKQRLGVR